MILDKLLVGQQAIIISVEIPRLLSLGFRIGSNIVLLRRSHGCLHVRIGTSEFALRKSDANAITISIPTKALVVK